MPLRHFIAALVTAASFCVACGGDDDEAPPPPVQHRPPGPVTEAPCEVVIAQPEAVPASHVPIGTEVTYSSNPPSSGPHYPVWAAYKEYTTPVDRRYYVHNLEHGGVVFLYRCDSADGCPDVVQGLRDAAASVPTDPKCSADGVRARVLITPDPQLDVPIAMSTWGWTYRAHCIHKPSLEEFARSHYGQGTEEVCADGISTFGPAQ